MARFTIRAARLDDVDVLRDVYRRSSLSNDGDRAALLANPDALLLDDTSVRESRTRIAIDEDRIVGFATIQLAMDIAELDDLFVDPDWMRRGVGRSLVLDAMAIASSLNATRIEVTANRHALAFYECVGFVEQGVRATQFGLGLRMQLEIAG